MNYWKQLRRIGNVIVLCIALLALVLAALRYAGDAEEAPKPAARPGLGVLSNTTGL